MKQLLFLYNPSSGKGGASHHLSTMVDTLTKADWLVTVYPTQTKGDASRIVQQLGPQYERVVCCGGDGTLSETVAGLMELEQPPLLGYIPAGSTNDCATTFQIPTSYRQAAQVASVAQCDPLQLDIGTLNQRPFVYIAAFGAFTQVAYDTPQDMKNAFGHLAYIMAGLTCIPSITPYHLTIEYDGQVLEEDFYYGMVCNTYSVGGMRNLPTDRVELDDGLFEVILVKKPLRMADIGAALQSLLYPTPEGGGGSLLSFHATNLRFISESPLPWTLDGEFGGSYPISQIQNHQKALKIIHG